MSNNSPPESNSQQKSLPHYAIFLENILCDTRLTQRDMRVLICLFSCVNGTRGDRFVWPSVDFISEKTSIPKNYVHRVLKRLREFGWIRQSDPQSEKKYKNMYLLNIEEFDTESVQKKSTQNVPKEYAKRTKSVRKTYQKSTQNVPPLYREELTKEHTNEPTKELQRARATQLKKEQQEIHDEVIAYYNKLAGRTFKKSANLMARIKYEKLTLEECKTIINNRLGYLADEFWHKHFYPDYLFQKGRWETHLNIPFTDNLSPTEQARIQGEVENRLRRVREEEHREVKIINPELF